MTPDLETPACLPCPFCGQQPTVFDLTHSGHWVECDNPACLVATETRTCDTPELAAQAWNTRAPLPA